MSVRLSRFSQFNENIFGELGTIGKATAIPTMLLVIGSIWFYNQREISSPEFRVVNTINAGELGVIIGIAGLVLGGLGAFLGVEIGNRLGRQVEKTVDYMKKKN